MTLPPMPPSYRINGTVTFQDGTPAAGAFVTLFDGDRRWKQVTDEVRVGSDGRFSLRVHEGINYVLSVRYMDPLTPQRTRAAGSTSFVGSEEKAKTLDVVLRPVR
ncbi:MAG: carboxypeptidase regulatory-like domain-containing protein [Acidobacteria bacterium]|nr:MAG: carboxypeptidase regulatory-like domain-containing protein [Acidobacteriota bacterium]